MIVNVFFLIFQFFFLDYVYNCFCKSGKNVNCISSWQIATELVYWADINNAIKSSDFLSSLYFTYYIWKHTHTKKVSFSGSVTLQAMRDSMSLPAYKFISL